MKHLLVIFLVLVTTVAFSQDIKKRYNFGFETSQNDGESDNWQLVPDDAQISYDTNDKVQVKRAIVFTRKYYLTDSKDLIFNLCLYQKVLLPMPSNQISVSVFSKNIDHQYCWLKIAGFDKLGKIAVTDSISIISDNWKEFTAKIAHKDIYLLSIEIRAKEQFEPFDRRKRETKLWLDSVSVVCDGKNLISINAPSNEFSENEIANIKNNIPMNEDMVLPENILNKIAEKKIIGFGETAHGSFETDKCKYNNIRRLISYHQCRLVLFEMPIDLVAQYNLYIHGYEIDSTYCKFYPGQTKIDTTYRKLSFLSAELERFVNWVKEFNAVHDDKVNIMGVDIHTIPESSNFMPPELNRYISSMKLRSNTVDSLVSLINSGHYRRVVPLQYAQNKEKQLTTLMGRFNYMVLLQTLKSITDSALIIPLFKSWSYWPIVHRDYILWQNAKQVLENFTDGKSPVVICAHYAHLDKISSIHFNEVVTLGQYLTKAYGDSYCHIGILLGQGEAGTRNVQNKKLVYQGLQLPVKGSLEYLASLTNQECFYKAGNINTKIPLMIRRSAGVSSVFQFIPAYFPGSMDGFIYIRNSTPSFQLQVQ